MDNMKTIYKPKDVRSMLNIAEVTLRKWAIALESNGYSFNRNTNGHRIFSDTDLFILKKFQTLVQSQNMTVYDAAKITKSTYSDVQDSSSLNDDSSNLLKVIEENKTQMNLLTVQIKEQQHILNNLLDTLIHLQNTMVQRIISIEERQIEQLVQISETFEAIKEVKELNLEDRTSKKSKEILRKFF
jgi:DNA-binding transcriptional MerR regulator